MNRSIKSSRGTRIGKMQISHNRVYSDNILLKNMNVELGGTKREFTFPKYGKIDTVDIFGLPPFNEWAVGIEKIEEISEEFSNNEHHEKFRSEVIGPLIGKIKLERKFQNEEETYKIHEVGSPERKSILGAFDIQSSNGDCSIVIERDINHSRDEINRLRNRLTASEKKYLQSVRREERLPDVVVLKIMNVDGIAPAAKMKMYPFWEKTSYQNETVRCLEIGYLDYGDNETEFDKKHGKWFKLISFDDFDHSQLEIREGNWRSMETERNGEKIRTLKNYEKYLYTVNQV